MTEQISSDLPEAPSIAFTQVYGTINGQVVQINLTQRAATIQEALDGLFSGCKYGSEKYHLTLSRPDIKPAPAAPAQPAQPSQPAAPAVPNAPAAAPAAAQTAPAKPSTAGQQVFSAIRLEITPDSSGKVRLAWYGPGRTYADITSTKTPEAALQLLSVTGAWSESHLQVMGKYDVRHQITWVPSQKTNNRGNPYKDIVAITNY